MLINVNCSVYNKFTGLVIYNLTVINIKLHIFVLVIYLFNCMLHFYNLQNLFSYFSVNELDKETLLYSKLKFVCCNKGIDISLLSFYVKRLYIQ